MFTDLTKEDMKMTQRSRQKALKLLIELFTLGSEQEQTDAFELMNRIYRGHNYKKIKADLQGLAKGEIKSYESQSAKEMPDL